MFSTGIGELDQLLNKGYPDRSAILAVGPPGVGKEALGYWFMESGLGQGDFCVYITRQSVSEVLQDMKAFVEDGTRSRPVWIASEGGDLKWSFNDLAGLSVSIKDTLRKSNGKRIRIITDVMSSLLMLNSPETIYKFFSQLSAEIKQYDAVVLATLEEGMHQPQAIAAMEQLFDGVMELRLYEEGLRVLPLLRILKMRGMSPRPEFFQFSFNKGTMEISAYVR